MTQETKPKVAREFVMHVEVAKLCENRDVPPGLEDMFVRSREVLPESPTEIAYWKDEYFNLCKFTNDLEVKVAELEKEIERLNTNWNKWNYKELENENKRYEERDNFLSHELDQLKAALQVSLDAGKEFDEEIVNREARKAYLKNHTSFTGGDRNYPKGFKHGARWAWSAKPVRPLTELTAGELMEHPLIKQTVELLRLIQIQNENFAEEAQINVQEYAAEALAPFRGEE